MQSCVNNSKYSLRIGRICAVLAAIAEWYDLHRWAIYSMFDCFKAYTNACWLFFFISRLIIPVNIILQTYSCTNAIFFFFFFFCMFFILIELHAFICKKVLKWRVLDKREECEGFRTFCVHQKFAYIKNSFFEDGEKFCNSVKYFVKSFKLIPVRKISISSQLNFFQTFFMSLKKFLI